MDDKCFKAKKLKILIIGNSKGVFAKELQSQLVNKGRDVYLLDFAYLELYNSRYELNDRYAKKFAAYQRIPKLRMFFRMWFIADILKDFDLVNIHVGRWYYSFILHTLKKKKVVVSFYGSDFYRATNFSKKLLLPLLKIAKTITFTNPLTKKSFLGYYEDFHYKSHICRFGLGTLDYIDKHRDKDIAKIKNHLGYSTTKKIVTCGYNATKAQQHQKIIEQLIRLPKDFLQTIQFIFPMTYGDNQNRDRVESMLAKSDLDYIVLRDFLYDDDNAYIKLASDVMINMLETDSFSGSMQEFLYAKNRVITGSWLPYEVFDVEGIIYDKIDSIDNLGEKLQEVLKRQNVNLQKNVDVIYSLSSWKNNISNWIEAYAN
ncbi:MAG TPA: hypothetical protein ENN12_05045 [Epsilonproteobacteria bacterium]|nr:hypothetical protein [Campylobacterota bacterium]